jgi:predicted DNA-binding transcriptional regulator AlpA
MNTSLRRIIRRKALKDYLPLGNTQLREHELHDPDFPKRVPLSTYGRAVGYFEDEVAAYQEKLAQRRDAKLADVKSRAS